MRTFTTTSATPRTDAVTERRIVKCRLQLIVDADFAKELETELSAVTTERDELLAEVNNFISVSGRHNTVAAYVRLQKAANRLNRRGSA